MNKNQTPTKLSGLSREEVLQEVKAWARSRQEEEK